MCGSIVDLQDVFLYGNMPHDDPNQNDLILNAIFNTLLPTQAELSESLRGFRLASLAQSSHEVFSFYISLDLHFYYKHHATVLLASLSSFTQQCQCRRHAFILHLPYAKIRANSSTKSVFFKTKF